MTAQPATRLAEPFAGRPILLAWLLVPLLACVGTQVHAASQVDIYQFPDAQVEARYRVLIDEFRCPKCLNTNLAGSDAPIARDLRRTVHRLLVVDGLRDDEVRDFLQERYGDFVLYNPPFKPGTWILWLSPVAFVALGAIILLRVLRKQRGQVALSDVEVARLRSIVDDSAAQGRPVTQDPG